MKKLYLLSPPELFADVDKNKDSAEILLAAYQALWHPAFLSEAETPPTRRDLSDLPTEADCILAIPKRLLEAAPRLIQDDFRELAAQKLVGEDDAVGIDGPNRILAPLQLPCPDAKLLLDFYALGYAYLGLDVLFKGMGHDNSIDNWSLMTEVRQAAESFLQGNLEGARSSLQASFDLLLSARQIVYPATINWVDVGLYPPGLTLAELQERLAWQVPMNVLLSGSELEAIARDDEALADQLRSAVSMESIEILGGTYDQRPWTLLPNESRYWQLSRSASVYEQHLGREVDAFGSRTLALTPDLAQPLMKFQFRYALHAAFDGSRYPHFRDPKLHWTGPDGSVIETLARVARDAGAGNDAFAALAALAKTIMTDRSATLVLAHWINRGAPWYHWILRAHEYAPVFGRFQTFSDYFLNSSTPDRPTRTRVEEYYSNALFSAVARKQPDPISRWIDHHDLRGRLDAVRSLVSLHQIATGESPANLGELEEAVETAELPGSRGAMLEEIAVAEQKAIEKLSGLLLAEAQPNPGYLILNPCSFPRRVCLQLDDLPEDLPIQSPLKAIQSNGGKGAVIVDTPGWGFAWIPRQRIGPPDTDAKPVPIAAGKRLRNEYIEMEVDSRSGGIRGVWELRSGYSRLGQQIVHSLGSKQVCKKLEITSRGPAYGEITTEGEIFGADGRTSIATFRQTARMWLSRPHVEISIHLEPRSPVTGDPRTNYFACRWAWPDEKTILMPGSGFQMDPSRATELEAPQVIELRERKLITDIFPHGLPFHWRIGPRMLDTVLIAQGESRQDFSLSFALDLAHPWPAAIDTFWPVSVAKVEHGPPKLGRTGWLGRLDATNVICSRMIPFEDYRPGVQIRMTETEGTSTRAQLRFARNPSTGRLTNAKGQLIFDLHTREDALPVDFSPHESLQVEVLF